MSSSIVAVLAGNHPALLLSGAAVAATLSATSPAAAQIERTPAWMRDGAAALVGGSGPTESAQPLTDGDDHVINTDTLVLTASRDFGAGKDLFTNKGGTVRFGKSDTPLKLAFNGLEQFANEGGQIDLRNGGVGDTLTLSGAYSASGDARLALDVSGGASDSLVVMGKASGLTHVSLAALKPEQTTLFASPIKLISVGAGSTANAFRLAAPDQGLVRYRLTYDAKGLAYMLDATAGRSVLQSVRAVEGLRFAWRSSAEAFDTEQAMVRAAGGEGGRLWAVAHGSRISRDSDGADRELKYDQDLIGGQMGVSLGAPQLAGGDTAFGLTGGYVESTLSFQGAGQSIDMQTFNLGAYGAWRRDDFYATALIKVDHHSLAIEDGAAGFKTNADGLSWGVRLEAGHRIHLGPIAFDPIVGLDYLSTRVDDLMVLGQQVVLDDRDGFSGRFGGRALARYVLAEGRHLELSAGLELVHDFDAAQKGSLVSNKLNDAIELTGPETYGRALAGVQMGLTGHLQAYIQGEGRFGDGQNGGGLRIGARYRF